MRTLALLLAVALALGAAPVRAEEVAAAAPVKQRGFLTGLGLGLLVSGMIGMGAGIGGLLSANEAYGRVVAYGGMVAPNEVVSVNALNAQVSSGTALAAVGFIGGALALAGGVICVLLDTPRASVAFVPTSQGGVFVFSGRF